MTVFAGDFPVHVRLEPPQDLPKEPPKDPHVEVARWGAAAPTTQDPTAPFHDCLWRIALEQAVLERMKATGENFPTALRHVQQNSQEVRKQLDIVCDDNGFRRIDGTGPGTKDPNLIDTGNGIKVRIDPASLYEQAPTVVEGQPSGTAYNTAVGGDQGGVNLVKKEQLDTWLQTIPGFSILSEPLKAALITAYAAGADPRKLVGLVNSSQFNNRLSQQEQIQLLALYTKLSQGRQLPQTTGPQAGPQVPGRVDVLAVIDQLLQEPVDNNAAAAQLKLMSTLGFARLSAGQQHALLNRYTSDVHFRAAIDQIVGNAGSGFTRLSDVQQAHVLDVMRSFTREFYCKGTGQDFTPLSFDVPGHPAVVIPYDQKILLHLYQRLLTQPGYKLSQVQGTQQTPEQSALTRKFVDENWPRINELWMIH